MSATWLLAIAALAADGQSAAPMSQTAVARVDPRPAAAAAADHDRLDVVLLLDDGPLHVRLHVGLGGRSLAELRRQYVDRLMASLDADGDGKLSREEAARSPLFRTKSRPSANAFLDSLRGQTAMTRRDVEQKVNTQGGELIAFRQYPSSAMNDLEVFKLLDANGDGLLDTAELLAAEDLILSRDEDGDHCVSFEEFFPPPPPPDPMQVMLGVVQPELPPIATVAEMVLAAQNPTMPQRLIRQYRRRGELALGPAELGWPQAKIEALDANRSGDLDARELARLAETEPDLELTVDLQPEGMEGGVIHVRGTRGERLDDGGRPDYARVSAAGTVITFSHRNLDPVQAALDDAMRQFNLLDADANGYLDRDETALRIRFERGLFDLIDADGDGKIFAEEMEAYVRALAEPAATTCRMNVYDTGRGFFMALDANADGRISERERRNAAMALARLERDGKPGISIDEPARHFHVEFVRGSYQLFGPSEQLVAQTPAFQQRRPTGPIWFQRMDRNNDGDLTFDEFLGPRPVFDLLDADGDGLIDPQEAAQWRQP